MIISDLNFCEAVEFPNQILGGATAIAIGDAYAYPGGAEAIGSAYAEGDITYTNATTHVSVKEKKNVIQSKAKVKVDALAIDENGVAKAKIRDNDVYVMHI
ncbi:hypothetical protein WA1_02175 [Scytonema hofmannii PCC 7110]|uniref:Uncharacterized protein n=1 Tax=Scytonema hofmannii PCC 7110 TaxID=128403 RepID=A0A139XH00_9CYAN|nr:hypothetical protein [Scytonema hofmannii]KYC43975.1 hypothetical protein WA1_02175 [Scytonema hofmannii PCC 7110]